MADVRRGVGDTRFEFTKDKQPSFGNFQFEFSTKTPIFIQISESHSAL